ncbi:uncharacterized protein LOC131064858 [Cryptomeria japonica]|uniref:uncharacterized protein LOC131064858 n=1 Tax=Cryptomeria japonica TaxID=3369 RepID=UPI0025AB8AAF|nr:uncharacterized protein LOC131064858 [Cryptomeria japonica]
MAEEKPSMIFLLLLSIINACAIGLAIAAERRKSTGHVVADKYDEQSYCVYNSDIATGFGSGAFFLLLSSQVLLMAVTRCLCCGRPLGPGGSRGCAILLFIFSWVTFVIAEACLLAGAVRNAYHTKYRGRFGIDEFSCETLRKGVFAAGAAFTLLNTIASALYYISFAKARAKGNAIGDGWKPYANEPGVAMSGLPR